jgi:hypothetical protein
MPHETEGPAAQVAALRAFLSFDPAYEQLNRQLASEGQLHGYGDLVISALDLALRRRLGHQPTQADAIRLAASLRTSLRRHQIELDPLVMEDVIRSAADGMTSGRYDDRARADVMLFMLGELISGEGLDEADLDDFLVMALAMAGRRKGN